MAKVFHRREVPKEDHPSRRNPIDGNLTVALTPPSSGRGRERPPKGDFPFPPEKRMVIPEHRQERDQQNRETAGRGLSSSGFSFGVVKAK